MATLTLAVTDTTGTVSGSFQSGAHIVITYTAGNGQINITDIGGYRNDSYASSWSHDYYCTYLRFWVGNSYTDLTIPYQSGSSGNRTLDFGQSAGSDSNYTHWNVTGTVSCEGAQQIGITFPGSSTNNIKNSVFGKTSSYIIDGGSSATAPSTWNESASNIGAYTATLTCSYSDGGSSLTASGWDWGTSTSNYSYHSGDLTSWSMSGLTRYTTYYYRTYVANAVGGYNSDWKSFTTLSTAPTVGPLTATPSTDSISVSYNIIDTGGPSITGTSVGAYLDADHTQLVSSFAGTSGTLIGLSPNTVYYLAAWVTNADNKTGYNLSTVTTNTAVPTVGTISTSNITGTSFDWSWSVSSTGGAAVSWHAFRVYTDSSYQNMIWNEQVGWTGTTTGLTPNTTYYIRAEAQNSAGTGYGTATVTTIKTAPIVSSMTIEDVTTGGASLSFIVTNSGGETVTDIAINIYSDAACTQLVDTIGSSSGVIFGLDSGTTYYVRGEATNSIGTNYTPVASFTTTATVPVISSLTTSSTSTSITGSFTVTDPGSASTTTAIKVYSDAGCTQLVGTINGNSGTLTGLSDNTTYYVRGEATNSAGTTYTSVVAVTTSASTCIWQKVNGTWKKGKLFVKVSGTWKEITSIWKNNNGTWGH